MKAGGEATRDVVRIQLAITPDPELSCVVLQEAKGGDEISHVYKASAGNAGNASYDVAESGECHAELKKSDIEGHQYINTSETAGCICPVFEKYNCIPEIREVRSDSIVVVVSMPDRNELGQIIEGLRDVGASVSVDWIVNGGEGSTTTEIDVNSITGKQRQALEIALEEGYYETPREIDLGELAAKLDISDSAASQRLNAAETKLVKSFLEE